MSSLLLDSDNPDIYTIRTTASGPTGTLPFTGSFLVNSPSGDVFGWSHDAAMGWDPASLGRPEFLMLSTSGGIRKPDGSPTALGFHTGHWEVALLMEEAAGVIKDQGGIPFAAFCSDPCDGRTQGTTGMFDSLAYRNDAAIAHAAGLPRPRVEDWQRINRKVPRLVDALPNGPHGYATVQVYLAGGVPEVMLHLRDHGLLELDAPTVSGQSLGENLAWWSSPMPAFRVSPPAPASATPRPRPSPAAPSESSATAIQSAFGSTPIPSWAPRISWETSTHFSPAPSTPISPPTRASPPIHASGRPCKTPRVARGAGVSTMWRRFSPGSEDHFPEHSPINDLRRLGIFR